MKFYPINSIEELSSPNSQSYFPLLNNKNKHNSTNNNNNDIIISFVDLKQQQLPIPKQYIEYVSKPQATDTLTEHTIEEAETKELSKSLLWISEPVQIGNTNNSASTIITTRFLYLPSIKQILQKKALKNKQLEQQLIQQQQTYYTFLRVISSVIVYDFSSRYIRYDYRVRDDANCLDNKQATNNNNSNNKDNDNDDNYSIEMFDKYFLNKKRKSQCNNNVITNLLLNNKNTKEIKTPQNPAFYVCLKNRNVSSTIFSASNEQSFSSSRCSSLSNYSQQKSQSPPSQYDIHPIKLVRSNGSTNSSVGGSIRIQMQSAIVVGKQRQSSSQSFQSNIVRNCARSLLKIVQEDITTDDDVTIVVNDDDDVGQKKNQNIKSQDKGQQQEEILKCNKQSNSISTLPTTFLCKEINIKYLFSLLFKKKEKQNISQSQSLLSKSTTTTPITITKNINFTNFNTSQTTQKQKIFQCFNKKQIDKALVQYAFVNQVAQKLLLSVANNNNNADILTKQTEMLKTLFEKIFFPCHNNIFNKQENNNFDDKYNSFDHIRTFERFMKKQIQQFQLQANNHHNQVLQKQQFKANVLQNIKLYQLNNITQLLGQFLENEILAKNKQYLALHQELQVKEQIQLFAVDSTRSRYSYQRQQSPQKNHQLQQLQVIQHIQSMIIPFLKRQFLKKLEQHGLVLKIQQPLESSLPQSYSEAQGFLLLKLQSVLHSYEKKLLQKVINSYHLQNINKAEKIINQYDQISQFQQQNTQKQQLIKVLKKDQERLKQVQERNFLFFDNIKSQQKTIKQLTSENFDQANKIKTLQSYRDQLQAELKKIRNQKNCFLQAIAELSKQNQQYMTKLNSTESKVIKLSKKLQNFEYIQHHIIKKDQQIFNLKFQLQKVSKHCKDVKQSMSSWKQLQIEKFNYVLEMNFKQHQKQLDQRQSQQKHMEQLNAQLAEHKRQNFRLKAQMQFCQQKMMQQTTFMRDHINESGGNFDTEYQHDHQYQGYGQYIIGNDQQQDYRKFGQSKQILDDDFDFSRHYHQ